MIAPVLLSASANASVNDYRLALTPNSATVKAGSAATYNAQVSPTGTGSGIGFDQLHGASDGRFVFRCQWSDHQSFDRPTKPSGGSQYNRAHHYYDGTPQTRTGVCRLVPRFPAWHSWDWALAAPCRVSAVAMLGLLIGTFFVLVFLQADAVPRVRAPPRPPELRPALIRLP